VTFAALRRKRLLSWSFLRRGVGFLTQTPSGFGIGGTFSVLMRLRQNDSENDSVAFTSALDRDEIVRNAAGYQGGISLRGSTEATSARQAQNDPLVSPYLLLWPRRK
jgi:hypothetical protein